MNKKIISKFHSIIDLLDKQITQIESEVEKRESFFYEKSDQWQSSEKGEIYESKTSQIQDILDQTIESKEILESIVNELDE
jgi:vacuolar-type H+-ATPase subunit H